jgi:hypothetical protein
MPHIAREPMAGLRRLLCRRLTAGRVRRPGRWFCVGPGRAGPDVRGVVAGVGALAAPWLGVWCGELRVDQIFPAPLSVTAWPGATGTG